MVAGDWSVDVQSIQDTHIAEEAKGAWVFTGQPTLQEGPNELDFALFRARCTLSSQLRLIGRVRISPMLPSNWR